MTKPVTAQRDVVHAPAMTTSIPPEYQKDYTWDAIVFSDGATYVCIIAALATDALRQAMRCGRPSRGFRTSAPDRVCG